MPVPNARIRSLSPEGLGRSVLKGIVAPCSAMIEFVKERLGPEFVAEHNKTIVHNQHGQAEASQEEAEDEEAADNFKEL